MKKILLPLVLATFVVSSAQAQLHSKSNSFVGVKVGGTAATFVGDLAKNERFVYGLNAGLFASLDLGQPFSVQPELLFSMKGDKAPASFSDAQTILTYIDLPVALRYTSEGGLFAEAGPQAGYLLSAKYTNPIGEKVDAKDAFRKIDAGFLVGAGYQPRKGGLGVGARYNGSVLSAPKDLPDGTSVSLRNSAIQLYVTYSPTHYHKPRKRSQQ